MDQRWTKGTRIFFFSVLTVLISTVWIAGWQYKKVAESKGRRNTVRSIGKALDSYHDEHGCFPPAILYDADGKPKHSWRALITPYLNSQFQRRDSTNYDFKQPWDSPANRRAGQQPPLNNRRFQYLAVVGKKAAWTSRGTRKRSDLKTTETLLVIALPNTGIDWYEPKDAVYDGQSLTLDGKPLKLTGELFILLASGNVRHFTNGIRPEMLKALIELDADKSILRSL